MIQLHGFWLCPCLFAVLFCSILYFVLFCFVCLYACLFVCLFDCLSSFHFCFVLLCFVHSIWEKNLLTIANMMKLFKIPSRVSRMFPYQINENQKYMCLAYLFCRQKIPIIYCHMPLGTLPTKFYT